MRIYDEKINNIVNSIDKFEEIKDLVIVKAVPIDNVSEENVYRAIHDIAICVYIFIDKTDNRITTLKIVRPVADVWGLSDDAIFDLAFENTKRIYEPLVTNLRAITEMDLLGVEFKKYPLVLISKFAINDTINAAVFAFDKDVRRDLYDLCDEEDYYISFTSVHEAIIMPKSLTDAETLKSVLVESVNEATEIADFLTYSLYQYNSDKDEIEFVI